MSEPHDHRSDLQCWFGLSYSQYLTIPRSIMEAMPTEWKGKMSQLLYELDDTFEWRPDDGRYWVQIKNDNGRYMSDHLREYRRPDRDYIESIRVKKETE